MRIPNVDRNCDVSSGQTRNVRFWPESAVRREQARLADTDPLQSRERIQRPFVAVCDHRAAKLLRGRY